jgi:hypothetical protein
MDRHVVDQHVSFESRRNEGILGVDPKVGTTRDGDPEIHGSRIAIRVFVTTAIRGGVCPRDKGFNWRHHGAHYHVETKLDGVVGAKQGGTSKDGSYLICSTFKTTEKSGDGFREFSFISAWTAEPLLTGIAIDVQVSGAVN